MEVIKNISFSENCIGLIKYLEENDIKYNKEYFVMDIYESNPHWEQIKKYLKKYKISYLSETIFTKKELQSAEWLTVRSVWRYDYPQPFDDRKYETITYTRENHCSECGIGLRQVDSFRMKKPPKWNQRHFMIMNWIEDEFFVNDSTRKLLEKNFDFLKFCDVKNKKGTEIFPDINQMIIPILEREGIIEEQSYLQNVYLCSACEKKKYHPSGIGMLKLKREIFENAPDIVKSAENFGWGCGSDRIIYISQKAYQFILSNHLERGLVFEPIDLID